MFKFITQVIEALIGLGLFLSFAMVLLALVSVCNGSNYVHDAERVLLISAIAFAAFFFLAWRRKQSFLWLFVWL